MSRGVDELTHLARRFVQHARAQLRPPPLGPADEAWVGDRLSGPELELWSAQALVDRAHTLAVARTVDADVAPEWLVPAALLHDVGKADAPLGLVGRTVATLLELLHVSDAPGRLGRYLRYTEGGAARLQAAGSDPHVVAWAREHHRPPAERSGAVPARWADHLVAADRGRPPTAPGQGRR